MSQHYKTDNGESLCAITGTDDVFSYGESAPMGSAGQPSDYCSACGEPEPEWEHVEDEEMTNLLNHIF